MKRLDIDLFNLDEVFPESFTQEQIAKGKTLFLKNFSLRAHKYYNGKIQILPKAGIFGFNWFNVWYTPGVSEVSTTIRDDNDASFELTNRGNSVAIVSDSTRVLGDGDCTPPGGMGVMEGKAYLMKYLGGIDAVPLCVDSKNEKGENDPRKIIQFVEMLQPSFGAVNLEDISQPNCFEVLDTLRESCDIPVWHDDAQGTACVTLGGLINALELAEKKISDISIVLLGAGASNTTIARLLIEDGADPSRLILFDSKGSLNKNRRDIAKDKRFYRKWELCTQTNNKNVQDIETALTGADVLIALSKPGPDTIKPDWISKMNSKAIVFACANPVPEIYPYAAKEAGAFIVATGRGDFPNQVNNSIGFPGILKGALMVRAKKITDSMAIAAAHSLAESARKRGITPESIVPTMDEAETFPKEAADVAAAAQEAGVARKEIAWQQAYAKAEKDITYSRRITNALIDQGYIPCPPQEMFQKALEDAVKAVGNE